MRKSQFRRVLRSRTAQANVGVTSLAKIEERLVKSILSATLALHILRSSRKPTSQLTRELLDIEFDVGRFVGMAMQTKERNLKGALAGAVSFIPFPAKSPSCAALNAQGSAPSSVRTLPKVKKRNN